MNTEHLRALAAAVDEGTFDAAAALLRISGSAFSQRIKALERDAGQVLLTRTVPVGTTAAGDRMLRLARQVTVLEDETRRSLGQGTGGRTVLSVAVNADSMATWFVEVLRQAATWDDAVLQLHLEDQEHTHELLRSGTVIAAITEDPSPVSGCLSMELGAMDYHAVAASALLDRYRREDGSVDFDAVPVQEFGTRDNLQRSRLAAWRADQASRGSSVTGGGSRGTRGDQRGSQSGGRSGDDGMSEAGPPRHQVPTVGGFNAAVAAGLGWGMIPAGQLPEGVLEGTHSDLVAIPELGQSRVALHWQRWTAGTEALDRLTAAVQQAARHMA
ncbi:ArgP/LysG family DNA-binding transcriptional regulator [Citricoccus muralis]|uniref:LysR family transcriptional regulator (Chromosome initiation inhibitor) n=1 Tax=Citricoccus muralis TaxID=169134 RepID=A0A3D9LE08_9MICC|nr:ArgP/LysG family DNA-binding transcriptional regulator [Citricoccus muralis]REE04455.1 LysR family transcriptional regulator (chromosome initiation inhibitor) [Citricoccus muralis]